MTEETGVCGKHESYEGCGASISYCQRLSFIALPGHSEGSGVFVLAQSVRLLVIVPEKRHHPTRLLHTSREESLGFF